MGNTTPAHHLAPSALGCPRRLPAELRVHIYSLVLPSIYRQRFRIDRERGQINERVDNDVRPIGLPYTSKNIRGEAIPAISKIRICRVVLDIDALVVSMPWQDMVLGIPMALPLCSGIEITVRVPAPRSALDLFHVRQNVAILVRWLVAQENHLPNISARLDGESAGAWEPTYNDVAMLLGPFGGMRGIGTPQVACVSSFKPGAAARLALQQCQAIESAMRSKHDYSTSAQAFVLQQLLIDIKLEMVLYHNEQRIAAFQDRFHGMNSKTLLGNARSVRLLTALWNLNRLLLQCREGTSDQETEEVQAAASGALYPSHLPNLYDLQQLHTMVRTTLGKTEVPQVLTHTILDLGRFNMMAYMMWASGCLTCVNPYY
ncbi:hypothetical protein LTR86_001515 [Recurvomyces mirabilis]|nr:hypothetical protein LTR86_001515 [Recurvomyces mirabilis]